MINKNIKKNYNSYKDNENYNNNYNNNLEKDFDYETFKRESINKLYEGKGLSGKNGIFTGMIKDFLETALKEELNNHLKSEKSNKINNNKNKQNFDCDYNDNDNYHYYNNRKNGYTSKNLKTSHTSFELNTPRDREGSFEPKIVKKNQTVLTEELDNKIIGLYALGMSYRDISNHIEEMYGINISKTLIGSITDKIIPKIGIKGKNCW